MKVKKILGFIALAVAVLLPMSAKAATWGLTYDSTTDSEGYTIVTVKGIQDGTTTAFSQAFTAEMTLENMELISYEGTGVWQMTVSGNTVTFVPSTPVTDSETVIGTMKFKKIDTAQNCRVIFNCNDQEKTVTPTPENPKTGNVLPYAVIVAGIGLAGAVYYVTRKNNKLYNI